MRTVNQVKMTNDYGLFTFIGGNRDININQLSRLSESIEEDYIPVPIIVNEKKQIIDGQHRYEVVKTLKKPVYYIEIEGLKLPEVHRLNNNTKNWTATEYMNGYAKLGYPDYIQYKEFKKKYNFGHNETMALLQNKQSRSNTFKDFREGLFVINSYKSAVRNAEKILIVKQYYDGYKRRSFVFAMMQLFNNDEYNHAEFLHKLSFQSVKLVDCTNVKQYISLIEDIHNYHRKDKIRLY
tara:strand:+ start:98 stop:811 length:714 start_codon:yes stop_codon:yes gene_type:complete